MEPLISIVIPVYNAAPYLPRCVDSVLAQTYQNMEILLIDDGSTDGSAALCDEYASKEARISVIHQGNSGVSTARNVGVEAASGEYIAFVDGDDYVSKYYLQEACAAILQTGADFVIGGTNTFKSFDEVLPDAEMTKPDYIIFRDENIRDLSCNLGCLRQTIRFDDSYVGRGPVCRLVKKEIAEHTPFHKDLHIFEDLIWNLETLSQCRCVCIVKGRWYWYWMNPDSATHRYDAEMLSASTRFLNAEEQILDLKADKEYLTFLYAVFDCLLLIRRSIFAYADASNKKLRRTIKKTIYTEYPWLRIKEKRFFDLSPAKYKILSLLYRFRMLFLSWRIKELLSHE